MASTKGKNLWLHIIILVIHIKGVFEKYLNMKKEKKYLIILQYKDETNTIKLCFLVYLIFYTYTCTIIAK